MSTFVRRVLAGSGLGFIALLGSFLVPVPAFADADVCMGQPTTIVGTDGDDNLVGSGGDDVISGLGGNDTIDGGGGDDTICGDEGDDLLEGGDGDDAVRGEEGADEVSGGNGDDLLSGAPFFDLPPTGPTPSGPDGDDTVLGGDGGDFLFGGPGDDTLDGGADGLESGEGDGDSVSYSLAAGSVTANIASGTATGDGNDTLIDVESLEGSIYDDVLIGDGGRNFLWGDPVDSSFGQYSPGDDELFGKGGQDGLFGEGGRDLLNGGKDGFAGSDFAIYFEAPTGIVANLAKGTATGWGKDTLVNIENLTGSDHDDTLIGDDRRNFFGPGLGNDDVRGGKDLDTVSFSLSLSPVQVDLTAHTASGEGSDELRKVETIIGTDFGDELLGSDGLNLFEPGAGDDTVDGRGGQDCIDFLMSSQGVQVDLGAGTAVGEGSDVVRNIDCLSGSHFDDVLTGDIEPNLILGYEGDDLITGGEGDDLISGMAGNDELDGGEGEFDVVDYLAESLITTDPVSVEVDLSAGSATIHAGSAVESDQVSGFEGIIGTIGADTLTGDGAANYLYGEAGNDLLHGLDGDDWMTGDEGPDTAEGGAGFDNCAGFSQESSCEGSQPPPEPALLSLLGTLSEGFRHH
jgi:Ca2+-binding RTX toxin-like protein